MVPTTNVAVMMDGRSRPRLPRRRRGPMEVLTAFSVVVTSCQRMGANLMIPDALAARLPLAN